MTDDMGCDLEFLDVDKLTFPQWRDWLAEYNKFIGERDVRYAAGLRERDERIEKLEAALREIADGPRDADKSYVSLFHEIQSEARKALEEKNDAN